MNGFGEAIVMEARVIVQVSIYVSRAKVWIDEQMDMYIYIYTYICVCV